MTRRAMLLLLLGLAACPVLAQPGPGLFGDRRWRAPVANVAALPASGAVGEVRLAQAISALYWWDGDSWELIGGGGAGGDPPHSRVVTVDAGGLGDYSSIKAACDYVATQTRADSTQWLILVYPGEAQPALGYDDWYNYLETAFTVPTFTTVQGVAAGHNTPVQSNGAPIIQLRHASGAGITLGHGSSLVNLEIIYNATPTATASVLSFTSGIAALQNVAVKAVSGGASFPIHGISVSGSAASYAYDTSVTMGGLLHASSATVLLNSSGGLAVYGGRFMSAPPCSALMRADAGLFRLFWTRIDSGDCTVDLNNVGADVRVIGTPYGTASGTITHDDGTQGTQFCKTFSGSGSPEGVVTAPVCSSYWRRDGAAATVLYLKESGSGNTGWAPAVDDVPEAGDFGALALTGDVTSSGLAATVAADAVALGTDTTGNYVSSATASQGLALTGTEGASLGLQDCAAAELLKRNAGDTAWECAADATGGGGGIGGSTGATDNALLRADGTAGATLQSSAITVDDSGYMTLPNGTVTTPSLRWAHGGIGLFSNASNDLKITSGSLAWWTISTSEIKNFNGGRFANLGSGEAIFSPNPAGAAVGLGSSAAGIATMYAGSSLPAEEWRKITTTIGRAVHMGQVADTPQAVTCADSGNASPGALTVNPVTGLVYITNSDADGCALTLGETNVASGMKVELVVVSTAGGTVDFADTATVTELAGAFTAGLYDSLALRYISDRWIETGRSDN